MIYAKTISPEYTDSTLFFDDVINYYNNIIIDGHSNHFNSYNDEPLRKAMDVINNYYEYEYHYGFHSFADFMEWYAPKKYNGKNYSFTEMGKIRSAIESGQKDENVIILILSIAYGEPYEKTCLKGCSQGDWVYCYHPESIEPEVLTRIETLYFNTGTEVAICETSDLSDETGERYYIIDWDIKRGLAHELGVSMDEITLFEFDGYNYTPKYKQV